MKMVRTHGGIIRLRDALSLAAAISLIATGSVQADPGKGQGAAKSAGKGNADWAHERAGQGAKQGVDEEGNATVTADEEAGKSGANPDKAARKAAKQEKKAKRRGQELEKQPKTAQEKSTDAARKGADANQTTTTSDPAPPVLSAP